LNLKSYRLGELCGKPARTAKYAHAPFLCWRSSDYLVRGCYKAKTPRSASFKIQYLKKLGEGTRIKPSGLQLFFHFVFTSLIKLVDGYKK